MHGLSAGDAACPPQAWYANGEYLHHEAREGSEDKKIKIKIRFMLI